VKNAGKASSFKVYKPLMAHRRDGGNLLDTDFCMCNRRWDIHPQLGFR
jgi:hypothetical protein